MTVIYSYVIIASLLCFLAGAGSALLAIHAFRNRGSVWVVQTSGSCVLAASRDRKAAHSYAVDRSIRYARNYEVCAVPMTGKEKQ